MCWGVSKLFPPRYRWSGSKVVSCMGAFLQVGFSTMSATSLAPMMCYKHPNGLRSILKYPGVLCGSADHDLMLVIGWILLTVFVLGFVALCTFAVKMDARLVKFWTFSVSLNENAVKTVRCCFTSSRTFCGNNGHLRCQNGVLKGKTISWLPCASWSSALDWTAGGLECHCWCEVP